MAAPSLTPFPYSTTTKALEPGPGDTSESGLIALGLAGLCAFLNVYASQPLLPTLERALDASKTEVAMTVSAPSLAVAIAAPFFGMIGGRLGLRRVIVASIFALAVPTGLAATAPSIHWLVFWRFAQGLCVPGIYAIGIAYAARQFRRAELGHAMAILVTGNVIGGSIGRTLSGQIAAALGWRSAFLALSLLTLIGGLITAHALPEDKPATSVAQEPRQIPWGAARLVTWEVLGTYLIGFSVLFIQVAMFTYVTFHLAAAPFLLGPSTLGSVFAIYLIGALVTPRAGRLIDRIGTERGMALAVSVGLAGSLLTLLPSLPTIVLGLALCATATFVGQSAATSHLSRLVPEPLRARASGLYLSFYYVGGAVGGIAPAMTWQHGGWTACVFLVTAVQIATLLCIGMLRPANVFSTGPATLSAIDDQDKVACLSRDLEGQLDNPREVARN